MESFFQETIWWLAHSGAAFLCLAGIVISIFAISGTWLVCLAGFLLMLIRPSGEPGLAVNIGLLGMAGLLEVYDFLAGKWGITRRGGSSSAGWAALLGGLVGMIVGGFLPLPLIGSIIGMLTGSFLFAFWVERRRLQHDQQAAHIARGAVWARLQVMVVKTVAALGMTVYLWYIIFSQA